jgi:Na+/H+-dicarboxylate symporter
VLDPGSELSAIFQDGLILGVFDVVGRVFIASLKLLVVPLVMVSLICGMSSLGTSSRMGSIAGPNHRALSVDHLELRSPLG